MIKINLALRKGSGGGGGGGSASSGGGSLFAVLGNLLKKKEGDSPASDVAKISAEARDLPIRKVVILVATYFLLDFGLEAFKADEMGKLEAVLNKLNAEKSKLQAELSNVKKFEEIRKKMDADELVLKTKLNTIDRLLADRQSCTKILTTVSGSIPAEVWLTSLRIDEKNAQFDGLSLNINQVTDFMKSLNESAFFKDVDAKAGKSNDSNTGAELANFQLSSRLPRSYSLWRRVYPDCGLLWE